MSNIVSQKVGDVKYYLCYYNIVEKKNGGVRKKQHKMT